MDRQVLVHVDFAGTTHFAGRLWIHVRNGRESASFEYDATWLQAKNCFALDPSLMLTPGPFYTSSDKPLFGAFDDSAPDRWGRELMRRSERRRAEQENQSPRSLMEIDYLLQVDDEARQGALRFTSTEDGPFLASDTASTRIPPLIDLPHLLAAAECVIADVETNADLRLLVAPGSSLGGTRPKASVRDRDGHLLIAKFPHQDDGIEAVRWEAVALHLAKRAGLIVPDWRLERTMGKPVLLLRRFDRQGNIRIPFLSAMSMLGAQDGETRSYLEFVDVLRQYGANPKSDMCALWRRIVFNILIANTDDHLRNHGFLLESADGWRLAPAYDLNPVPADIRARVLATNIDFDDGTASLELAMSVAEYFGLTQEAAHGIASEVERAVATWREEASRLGLTRVEIERMASAFELND